MRTGEKFYRIAAGLHAMETRDDEEVRWQALAYVLRQMCEAQGIDLELERED